MAKKFSPKSISLDWYSTKEILKISTVEITIPVSFDSFGHPVTDGLYDLRMGSIEKDQICQTCNMGFLHCPGHFGHVKLSRTVLNPLIFDTLYGLLKAMCFGCKNFKITNFERICFYTKVKALKKGLVLTDVETIVKNNSVEGLEELINQMEGEESSKFQIQREFVNEFFKKFSSKSRCPRCSYKSPTLTKAQNLRILRTGDSGIAEYFSPESIREMIHALYSNEGALIEEFFNRATRDMYFIDILPVIPNKFRPSRFIEGRIEENTLNGQIGRIMQTSISAEADHKFTTDLQALVFFYFDNSKATAGLALGHKQILEKKDGLFRNNMMGKRVNYAARTVISPDPSLETREIGVPLVFARKLTFPERVTKFNADRLRQAVMNGNKYPGCNFVQNGPALTNLEFISDEARYALANQLLDGQKIVWRHIQDGDPVLLNRQPTLHAVSLMSHTVHVLKNEKTLRMHYVNCKPYNADFDGDEMNIHFPQSLNSLSECYETFLTDHNYFDHSNAKPIRGLEQDHVVAAANLTMKDTFFTEDEFFSIISAALYNNKSSLYNKRFNFSKPCIENPIRLYSGKQVISSLLHNFNVFINFYSLSKVSFINKSSDFADNGNSIFDQNQESYLNVRNGEVITGILDKSSVGATSYSLIHSCGEVYGYNMCNELLTAISRVVNRYINLRGFTVRFDDILMNSQVDAKRHQIFVEGHRKSMEYQHSLVAGTKNFFMDNSTNAMVDGKMRNFLNSYTSQIVQLIGDGMYKQFPKNNMANIILTGAKGSMVNLSQISCALGQQELEGRRVPYMVSGKTLPCFLPLEMSPSAGGYVFERFLTGINPATFFFHCMAGREGLIDTAVKTANSGYLQRCLVKHLEGAKVEYDRTVRNSRKLIQFKYGDDGLDFSKDSFLKKLQFYESNISLFNYTPNSKVDFLENQFNSIHIDKPSINSLGENKSSNSICNKEYGIDNLISKMFYESINDKEDHLKSFMRSRYLNSLIDPGKAVGMLAAQSIGEPSTQMTLNTFHLAGVGGNNVTLGIPRLKEILMVAAKTIKTPIITVPVKDKAIQLKALFKRVLLEDCIDSLSLQETIVQRNGEYKKSIKIFFELRDHHDLCAKALDTDFLRVLGREIKKSTSAVGISEFNSNIKAKELVENEDTENDKFNAHEDSEGSSSSSSSDEKALSPADDKDDKDETGFLEDLDEKIEENDSTEACPLINLRKITSKKYVFEIFYDPDFNVFLMPIIQSILKKLVIKEIRGFEKANFNDGKLSLEGSDFKSIAREIEGIDLLQVLDFYNSYSNDIYSIMSTFGIEACRAVIVKELTNVFDVYGININIRHLYLVADYMTMDGKYNSFSRNSFSMDDSYILKMSFESCYTNLKNSAIFHQTESIQSPSARIAVGKCISQGTGSFELLYNLDFCSE